MNDKWDQFPPIEGNDSGLASLAVFAAAAFVLGMMGYIFFWL